LHDCGATLFIEVQDCLGIRAGAIVVTASDQLRSQFRVVIDLAVEDNPDGAVLVGHRLTAAFDVHDCQSPMSQPDRSPHHRAGAIGTAMSKRVSHPHQPMLLGTFARIKFHYPGDAAHRALPWYSTRTPGWSTRTDSPDRSKNSPIGTPSWSLIGRTAGAEVD